MSLRHSKHAVPHHHISEMNHRADVWAAYYSAWRPANNCFGVSIYIHQLPFEAARSYMMRREAICKKYAISHLYLRATYSPFIYATKHLSLCCQLAIPSAHQCDYDAIRGGAHCVRVLLASRRLRQFVQCTKFIVLVIANVFSACAIIYSRAIALRFDRKRALSLYLAH